MASSREYLEYVLEQCPEGTTFRAMMGEYVLYYREKVFGGIYDNRILVKPSASACRLLADCPRELPYEGAKEMLLLERIDDREFVQELLEAMYEELPLPGNRKKTERKCAYENPDYK